MTKPLFLLPKLGYSYWHTSQTCHFLFFLFCTAPCEKRSILILRGKQNNKHTHTQQQQQQQQQQCQDYLLQKHLAVVVNKGCRKPVYLVAVTELV